jgi:hypothetical protein
LRIHYTGRILTEAKPRAEGDYAAERRRLRRAALALGTRCGAERVASLEPRECRAFGRNPNGLRDRPSQHDVLTREKAHAGDQ